MFRENFEGEREVVRETHSKTPMAVECVANCYCGRKDYEKAKEHFERALEGYEAQYGKDHNIA